MTSDGQEENVPACGNLVDSFPEELYITSQAGLKLGQAAASQFFD
jgi:hypothetical protein